MESRRGFAKLVGALLMCAGFHAQAQDYPNRPIKMVIPYPPGAGSDTLGRMVADKLKKKLGQPVIVENRPGSGGNIGADIVAKAAPDGYTLMFTAPGPLVTNQALYQKLSFDPEAFAPVTVVATSPSTLVVNPKVKARNLKELVAFARSNPGVLNYASGGTASTPHISAEMFKMLAKVNVVHIPYVGSGGALSAVLTGQVDMAFLDLGSVIPHVKNGTLIAMGVGSETRKPALPDTPAIGEVLPGFVSMTWFGVVAPPKTPESITKALSAAIREGIREEDAATRLAKMNADPIGDTPAEMAQFMKHERERLSHVIQATGMKLD